MWASGGKAAIAFLESFQCLICVKRMAGEWRGGIAPPRSRRTGHDTLASSGSHCSAAAIEQAPVGEQPCLAARNALQPVDGPRPVPVQGLELPTSRQDDIDVPQGRVERRRVEPTIVVDPAPDVRVEHPGQTSNDLSLRS